MTQAALPQKSQWQIRTPFGVISSDISHNIFVSFFLRELVVGGAGRENASIKKTAGRLGWWEEQSLGFVLAAYTAFVKSVPPGLGTLPRMPILFVPLFACNGPLQGGYQVFSLFQWLMKFLIEWPVPSLIDRIYQGKVIWEGPQCWRPGKLGHEALYSFCPWLALWPWQDYWTFHGSFAGLRAVC